MEALRTPTPRAYGHPGELFRGAAHISENVGIPNLKNLLRTSVDLQLARGEAFEHNRIARILLHSFDKTAFFRLDVEERRERLIAFVDALDGGITPRVAEKRIQHERESFAAELSEARRDADRISESMRANAASLARAEKGRGPADERDVLQKRIDDDEAQFLFVAAKSLALEAEAKGFSEFLDSCSEAAASARAGNGMPPAARKRLRREHERASADTDALVRSALESLEDHVTIARTQRDAAFVKVEELKRSFDLLARHYETLGAAFKRRRSPFRGALQDGTGALDGETLSKGFAVLEYRDRAESASFLLARLKRGGPPAGDPRFRALFGMAVGSAAEADAYAALAEVRKDAGSLADPGVRVRLALLGDEAVSREARESLDSLAQAFAIPKRAREPLAGGIPLSIAVSPGEYAAYAKDMEKKREKQGAMGAPMPEKGKMPLAEYLERAQQRQLSVMKSLLGVRVNLSLGMVTGQLGLVQNPVGDDKKQVPQKPIPAEALEKLDLVKRGMELERTIAGEREELELARRAAASSKGPLERGTLDKIAEIVRTLDGFERELYSLEREYEYCVMLYRRMEGRAYARTHERLAEIELEFPEFADTYAGCYPKKPTEAPRFDRALLRQALRGLSEEKKPEDKFISLVLAHPSRREDWQMTYSARVRNGEAVPPREHLKHHALNYWWLPPFVGFALAGAASPVFLLGDAAIVATLLAGGMRGQRKPAVRSPADMVTRITEDLGIIYQDMTSRGGEQWAVDESTNLKKMTAGRTVKLFNGQPMYMARWGNSATPEPKNLPAWVSPGQRYAAAQLSRPGTYLSAWIRFAVFSHLHGKNVLEAETFESGNLSLFEEMGDTQHRKYIAVPTSFAHGAGPGVLSRASPMADEETLAHGEVFSIGTAEYEKKVTPRRRPPPATPTQHDETAFAARALAEEAAGIAASLFSRRADARAFTRLGVLQLEAMDRALSPSGLDDEILVQRLRLDDTVENAADRARNLAVLEKRRAAVFDGVGAFFDYHLLSRKREFGPLSPQETDSLAACARTLKDFGYYESAPPWLEGMRREFDAAIGAAARFNAPLSGADSRRVAGEFASLLRTHHASVRAGVQERARDCLLAAVGEPAPEKSGAESPIQYRGTLHADWQERLKSAVDLCARLAELEAGTASDSAACGMLVKADSGEYSRVPSSGQLAAASPTVRVKKGGIALKGSGYGAADIRVPEDERSVAVVRVSALGEPSGGTARAREAAARALPGLEAAARNAYLISAGASREQASVSAKDGSPLPSVTGDVYIPDILVELAYGRLFPPSAVIKRELRLTPDPLNPKPFTRRECIAAVQPVGGWKKFAREKNEGVVAFWSKNYALANAHRREFEKGIRQLRAGEMLDREGFARLLALNRFVNGPQSGPAGLFREYGLAGAAKTSASPIVSMEYHPQSQADPATQARFLDGETRISFRHAPGTAQTVGLATQGPVALAVARAIEKKNGEFRAGLKRELDSWGLDVSTKDAEKLVAASMEVRALPLREFLGALAPHLAARLAFIVSGPDAAARSDHARLQMLADELLDAELIERGCDTAPIRASLARIEARHGNVRFDELISARSA